MPFGSGANRQILTIGRQFGNLLAELLAGLLVRKHFGYMTVRPRLSSGGRGTQARKAVSHRDPRTQAKKGKTISGALGEPQQGFCRGNRMNHNGQ
jgi:hypothetical protein